MQVVHTIAVEIGRNIAQVVHKTRMQQVANVGECKKMANVGLTQAAELTGKAASTITRRSNHKDIKKRLSFTLNDEGEKLYDVSELERVFGTLKIPTNKESANDSALVQKTNNAIASNDLQQELKNAHEEKIKLLHDKIALLQTQLDETRQDREEWREQAKQNTRLLAHHTKEKEKSSSQTRGFLGRLFRK